MDKDLLQILPKYKKVIIWGYPIVGKDEKLHTHSFIHAAFYKAFKHLGCEVHWFNDQFHHQDFNYDHCLILGSTTDQCQYMPVNPTATYIMHNVNAIRWVQAGCKIFFIQVFTTDLFNLGGTEVNQLSNYTYLAKFHDVQCLYMPWATDLLPYQIDPSTATNNMDKTGNCVWIGSYANSNPKDEHQNGAELDPFFNACAKDGIKLYRTDPWAKPITFEENISLIRNAYLAPAINGPWQKRQQYIPCRIFKNISYAHFGITNNAKVKAMFGDLVVYDENTEALYHKSVEFKHSPQALEVIKSAMEDVRQNHTYINRIHDILNCIENL